MRQRIIGGFLVVGAVFLAGCGPSVPDVDLGRVVFGVPEIPEDYEPYKLPDLTAPAADQETPQSKTEPTRLEAEAELPGAPPRTE